MPEAVAHLPWLVGVLINRRIHPIFDNRRRWIMVDLRTRQLIPVTPNLYRTFSAAFAGYILTRLENNNDGELVMPLRARPNVEHIHQRNVRPRHNY